MRPIPEPLSRLVLLAFSLVAGCGDAPTETFDGGPGRRFGETCAANSDCMSGLCLATSSERSVCTRPCGSVVDCPSSLNWSCTPSSPDTRLCACTSDSDAEVCGDGRDNDCNGRTEEGCGRFCGTTGQFIACDDVCVDRTSDPENCGDCRVRCAEGASCNEGSCVCRAGETTCDERCANLARDLANCGECGNECNPGERCTEGGCECSSGVYCGMTCVPMDDPSNCGACGASCPVWQTCDSSECRCPLAETACSDGCFDLDSDASSCGECGRACPVDHVCTAGDCICPESGQTSCGAAGCHALDVDVEHCGVCDNACAPGELCDAGSCLCPAGTTFVSSAGASTAPRLWASTWDGDALVAVAVESPAALRVSWTYGTGGSGTLAVAAPFTTGDVVSRVRVSAAGSVWNVLVQGTHTSTGRRAHYLIQAAPRTVVGTRQLDSAVAPWANADLTYVPGVGAIVVWLTDASSDVFACVLTDTGVCANAPSVLGSAEDGIPSVEFDGSDELAVALAHGSPPRLRTYFASTALAVRGSHDDDATVVSEPAFVQGRAGQWVVLTRISSSRVRVLSGARLDSSGSHDLAMPRSLHWNGDELSVLSGGTVLFGSGSGPVVYQRFTPDAGFLPIDVALPVASFPAPTWNHALGVARVSRTHAVALGVGGMQTNAARITLSDCPR